MKVQTLFKKALAVLIAVMMLASVTVPSFAAEISATDESVTYTDVATVDEFNTAIAAGQNVRVTRPLTFETAFNVEKDVIIDLNNRSLTLLVGGNYVKNDANVTIKNGSIYVDGCVAKGDCIIGIGNYSDNATLTLDNVSVFGNDYSSAFAVFYVYNISTFNLNGCEVELKKDVASAGGFIKAHKGKNGIVNITDSSIALEDAKIGILDGTVTIKGSTLTIKGGANAINQSALTVIDSTITVDGADGRALTLSQGDVVVENSTLNFSNCSEGEIRFKNSFDLSLDENSTLVQCDVYADASATEANVNGKVVTGTETAPSQVSVYSGEAEVINHFDGKTINDLYQLKEFRDSVNAGNNYAGKIIKLATDIDLAGIDWEPIGTSANPFKGSFDGDNHTIKNLYINGSMDYDNGTGKNYVGLFGYINNGGSLSNITIENADVSGCLYVGSLVGRVYIGDAITNCHVKGNITVDGYWYVAALAGRYEYAEGIFNCSVDGNNAASSYVKCDTTLNSDHDGSYVGGIVGFTTEPNPVVTISNNSVKNISISGLTRVGGISGIAHQGNIFTGNTVENVNLEAGEGVTTVGLIAGACQGTASSPAIFEGNTVTSSTAVAGDVVVDGIYGTNINGTLPVTNYEACVGTAKFEKLVDAVASAKDGDVVTMLLDVADTGRIVIKENITVDGNGFTVSGNSNFDVAADDVTIKNVNFKNISNEKGTLSAIYASNTAPFDGKLAIINNTFDTVDWDAIQIAPVEGAEIIITGNTFVGTAVRYVHIQSKVDVDFSATVTGNIMNNAAGVYPLDVYYFADADKINVSGNHIANPDYICVLDGDVTNLSTKALPIMDETLANEVVYSAIIEREYNTLFFTDLQTAIDAANAGETVELLADIALDAGVTIAADDEIVLDLNGKTISQTKTQTAGYQMILNDGKLTIEDSVGGGKISYTDNGNGGEYISDTIYNRGTLVINSGTIENLSSATVASNGYPHAVDTYSGIRDTSVTVNGGTIYCAEYSAIRMFCVSATNKADLVINGGTIKGAIDMQNGTKNAALGSLTINDGAFEITKNANNIRFANWNGGATAYGITASINGGSFDGGITSAYVPAAANWNSKIITGGTFASDVTEYTAEGFKCVKNADGTYGVLVRDSAFAINGAYISEIVNGVATIVWDITIGSDYEMFALKVDGTQIYAVDGVYTTSINFNEVANKTSYEVTLTAYATINGALEKATVTIDSSDITFGVKAFDANGDSYIDIRDVVRLKKASAGMYDFDYDVNGDCVANDAADLALLRRAILTWSAAETIHATPWDGVTTFPAVDLGNKILAVYYPEQLAWISEQVAAGNNLNAYDKIVIARDIDLNNKAWTPIGGATKLSAIFDGQGNTISNLNVQGTKYVGLIGITDDDVMNVNIENATVVGTHYVAAVVGYMYYDDVINCSVTNATITCVDETGEDGDKVGAIVGYITESGVTKYQLTGCSATDVNITANRDAGYIVGMLQKGVYFTGNTATNCNVTHSGHGTGANLAPAANYNGMVGRTNDSLKIENKVAVITNPAEMVLFANYVNAGNETSGYTFKLGADIDLKNAEWTPIGNSTTPFKGTFDGQGHTISNLTITTPKKSDVGLFGMTTNGEIKNFTLENADVAGRLNVGAVAGTPYTSKYSDITLTGDIIVEGMAYVGALGGKNCYANVTNITIDASEDSYVKATSTENGIAYRTYVGGLFGFMGEGGHTVSNVTSNIDVYGDVCDVGGIVGIAHYGNNFVNVVSTGDVYLDTAETDYEVGGIAGVWHNGGSDVTMIDCGFTGTIYVNGAEFNCANGGLVNLPYSSTGTGKLIIGVTTETGLDHALNAGGDINVMEDVTTDSFVVAEDATTNVALNGNTISGTTITNNGTLYISDGTIENDVRGFTNNGTAILTNVTINAGDSSNYSDVTIVSGDTTYNNVTINSAGGGVTVADGANVTFNSGSVDVSSKSTSGRYVFYVEGEGSTLTINGGDFSFSSTLNQRRAYIYAGAGTTVYVTGGNFDKASTRSGYTAGILGTGTVIITGGTFKFNPTTWVADGYKAVKDENGVYTVLPENADLIVYDSAELDAAIADGETAIALGSGNFIIPDSAQGKTLTFVGNGNTVIATQDDGSYEGCDYSLDGATVTFENITINTDSTTYTGYARLKATYNNCTINGTYTLYDDSVFNNCTFNVSGDVYNIWTWGATNATFNGCTFNSDGKALLLYGQANTNLTVNNCVFNDNGGLTDLKAAIEIGNDYGNSYTLTVNNTVVNGYEINDKGINTGTTLYGNKNSMVYPMLKVTVDGVPQNLEEVKVTTGSDLQSALASGNKEVVLEEDVDAEATSGGYSVAGVVVDGDVLDGNGKTLTVENANSTWDCAVYTNGGVIKNLTIAGAFRGIFTAGCSSDIIVDNCVIDDVCYTISSDGSNANYSIIVTNTTLNGWTSYTGGYKSVSFTDCKFGAGTGGYSYAYCRPYSDTTFTNCVFEEGYTFDSLRCTSTFINCYVGDTLITEDNVVELLGDSAANIVFG